MWARSIATSNGDGGSWELGIFNIGDTVTTIPKATHRIQGNAAWIDLNYGCPGEGCKVGVIPTGQAWGWISGAKVVIDVYPDKQNITISCDGGCPEPFPKSGGIIVLTASENRD